MQGVITVHHSLWYSHVLHTKFVVLIQEILFCSS